MRIDKYLTEKGFAESRSRASALISGGFVRVGGRIVTKDSAEVSDSDVVEVKEGGLPYVSRGGFKLAGAKATFGLDFTGKIAADLGASTGGFTDVLLQGGAAALYAFLFCLIFL